MLTSDLGLPDCVWNSVTMKCPPGVEAPTFLNCARTQVLGPPDGCKNRVSGLPTKTTWSARLSDKVAWPCLPASLPARSLVLLA